MLLEHGKGLHAVGNDARVRVERDFYERGTQDHLALVHQEYTDGLFDLSVVKLDNADGLVLDRSLHDQATKYQTGCAAYSSLITSIAEDCFEQTAGIRKKYPSFEAQKRAAQTIGRKLLEFSYEKRVAKIDDASRQPRIDTLDSQGGSRVTKALRRTGYNVFGGFSEVPSLYILDEYSRDKSRNGGSGTYGQWTRKTFDGLFDQGLGVVSPELAMLHGVQKTLMGSFRVEEAAVMDYLAKLRAHVAAKR